MFLVYCRPDRNQSEMFAVVLAIKERLVNTTAPYA